MMKGEEKQDVQRKKQAFHSLIRHQHIQDYFHSVRQKISQSQQQQYTTRQQVLELVQNLPGKVFTLSAKLYDSFAVIAPVLIKHIDIFCSKIVRLELVQWTHMVHIINRLLVSTADKEQISKIVSASLLPVLEGAEILASSNLNPITQPQLIETTLQYCYRLGGYVRDLNQLQQSALFLILRRLWRYSWNKQQEHCVVLIFLNILGSRYDMEEAENVTSTQQKDLETFKIMLITQIFYKDKEEMQLQKLLKRICDLATEQGEEQLFVLYLRLLIMMTAYLDKACFYYPLLRHHILHTISCVFYFHPTGLSDCVVMATRLLNNILVNQTHLTSEVLNNISLVMVINAYNRNEHRPEVQIEILQLFINLLHFSNDDSELVRQLVTLGVARMMIESLETENKFINDEILSQIMTSMIIMNSHHPIEIRALLMTQDRVLRKVMEQHPYCVSQIQNLLSSIQPYQENQLPL